MIERLFRQLLEWAAGHHDEGRYSPVGIGFHWVMAGLVIFQLGWGWWMGRQPVGGAMMAAYETAAVPGPAHAALARVHVGLSPVSLARAWTDWALNLAVSPGTQARLGTEAQTIGLAWLNESLRAAVTRLQPMAPIAHGPDADTDVPNSAQPPKDPRFDDSAWNQWPWSAMASANQSWERWWQSAAELRGMERHSREQLRFFSRQWLDMVSPGNGLLSNPQALQKAADTRGQSLVVGMGHAVDEWRLRQEFKDLEKGKWVKVKGWKGVDAAHEEITRSAERYTKG